MAPKYLNPALNVSKLSYWLTAKLFPLRFLFWTGRFTFFYLHQREAPARARPKAEALLASPKGRYWPCSRGIFWGPACNLMAPCGLRGCKNRPTPFRGRMLYKET